jgi:uncharacterized protein YnzC (UPF0291/DUF896 family)
VCLFLEHPPWFKNKQQAGTLTEEEAEEVDRYEEIDDYLSFLNRLVRNQLQSPQVQAE